MRTRFLLLALAAALLLTGCGEQHNGTASSAPADRSEEPDMTETMAVQNTPALPEQPDGETAAVYLGVERYGSEAVNKDTKEDFRYRFFVDGAETILSVENGEQTETGYTYDIQNHLKEGCLYALTLNGETVAEAVELTERTAADHGVLAGEVESAEETDITVDGVEIPVTDETGIWEIRPRAGGAALEETELEPGKQVWAVIRNGQAKYMYVTRPAQPYTPPVAGMPGRKTLKNLLATALMPVGTTLYIYGGGWDWQDVGSSVQATSMGVSPDWVAFFQWQDEEYTYKNEDPAHSYYPFHEWNEYYYAGLDCSGYLGWTVYNTLQSQEGREGYVGPSTKFAKRLSDLDFGAWSHQIQPEELGPGDIVSINGHVWLSLGACPDGSVLILHSTPSDSRAGQPGGGPQLSALAHSRDCQAFRLAERYLSDYYPAWYDRYPVKLCDPEAYCALNAETAGTFTWDLDGKNGGLTDPEGYREKFPEEILEDLFAGAEKPS